MSKQNDVETIPAYDTRLATEFDEYPAYYAFMIARDLRTASEAYNNVNAFTAILEESALEAARFYPASIQLIVVSR